MVEISLEQSEQLKNWSSERDAVVADLHINTEKNNLLVRENKTLVDEKRALELEVQEYKKLVSNKNFIESEIRRLTPINQQLERKNSELNEAILSGQESVNLNSWSAKRDALLSEISVKESESKRLSEINRVLAESNTEIENKIIGSRGRMAELDKQEEEYALTIGIEVNDLIVQKTKLQTERESLVQEINTLTSQKNVLSEVVTTMQTVHDKLFISAHAMDQVVGDVGKINSENVTTINNLLGQAVQSLQTIIDVNALNVQKTNVVINDLPRIIFDLQRDILERKKFNKHRI